MRDIKNEILDFWFVTSKPSQWFQVNESFDNQIRSLFTPAYTLSAQGMCDDWMNDPEGCVALCLVLSQFPRHMFRNTPKAYETDHYALIAAKHTVAKGYDKTVDPQKRHFIYAPYMRSENLSDQRRSMELFESLKEDDPIAFNKAQSCFDLIDRFGRFPHRNAITGRGNTADETEFLNHQDAQPLSA